MGGAVAMVDIPVALARSVDAVGPVQTGIEPLRRIRRADLGRQHVAMFVVEGAGIVFAVEVAALPAPVGPGAGHALEDLARTALAAGALGLGEHRQGDLVGLRAPQPLRHVGLGNLDEAGRYPGAAKILLGKDVGGNLRPVGRYIDALQLKDDRAVGVADFGVGSTKRHSLEWRFSCLRIPALEAHRQSPVPRSRHSFPRGVCSS